VKAATREQEAGDVDELAVAGGHEHTERMKRPYVPDVDAKAAHLTTP
jgi:hypothetical protein